MQRRTFLASAFAALACPALAIAGSFEDSIVSQLQALGYTSIQVSRTWLGRSRIVAENDTQRREIILNPRTGEILRDFWTSLDGTGGTSQLFSSGDDKGTSHAKKSSKNEDHREKQGHKDED